ncbi:YczI family protein [Bacillus cereus]|uniref:YczI family protein n=1 Tax=Bacillus cereus TaxID=1396 RepID=UPI00187AB1A1|nr:YczI family protein [Bacillus cereus]MBE7121560.1 DUF3953 domain-containing protein [Bacillus cereus]
MLKGLRITFSLIALSIAIYYFISDNRNVMPYMFISLGLMFFTMGIDEVKEQRKGVGVACFLVGAATLLVSFPEIFR